MLGIEIPMVLGILLSTLVYLSLLVAITPGNLGIQEGIIVLFVSKVLEVGTAEAIVSAFITRAVYFIFLAITGPLYSYVLLRKFKKTIETNSN